MGTGGIGERTAHGLSLRSAACLTVAAAACWAIGNGRAFAQAGYPAPAAPATSPYPGSSLEPIAPPSTPTEIQNQIGGGPSVEPAGVPQPGWTFLPRVDVSEAFNDNIFQTSRDKKSDFITYITPSIDITGDLPRLQTSIFYAPTGIIYASHGNQDLIAQHLNAIATATLVPETFFIDLRGLATVQPTSGGLPTGSGGFTLTPGNGLGAGNASFLTRNNATQSESFSIAPYLSHRFGTFGTLKVGVAYSYTDSSTVSNSGVSIPASTSSSAASGSLNTYTEVVQFTSGEDWGRIRYLGYATGTQYEGSGVTQGAYQYIFSNELGYAITRNVTVFGELGAEDIRFKGIPVTTITDAIWSGGAIWTPNADSSITAGYGHRFGQSAALFNAYYQVSPRTRVFGQYQVGLGTDLTQLQSYVINTDIDPFGNSIDPTTGAPLFLTNNILGSTGNSNLYRTKTFNGGGQMTLDRDQFTLQLLWQDRQVLATTNLLTAQPSSGFSSILSWIHQLNPDLQSTLVFSYGRQNGTMVVAGIGREIEDTYAAQVSLRYNFTETLSGIAQYTFTDRTANIPGLSFTQDVVLVGLSKQF